MTEPTPAIANAMNEQLAKAESGWRVKQQPYCLRIIDEAGEFVDIVPLDTTAKALLLAERFMKKGFHRGFRHGGADIAEQMRRLLGCAKEGGNHG